jgi:O-antigen ligase
MIHRFEVAQLAFTANRTSGSTYERIYLIQTAYEVFSENFGTILFGTGQQTFFLQNKLGVYAHNNYMEIITNLGITGIVIFYSIHANILKKISEIHKKDIKYFLYGFILIILFMDTAMVSYAFKPTFFIFIFLVIYIENERSNKIHETN